MAVDPLWITLAVTLGAFILFVTEAVRPAFTALLVATTLMVFRVLTPAEGFSGPGADTTITVLCMFILAVAIERTGLLEQAANKVVAVAKGSAAWSFALLAVMAGLLSTVLNNTPVVVLLIPVVLTVAKRSGLSPSRYLMPLSFAAMLGGTMTLIGTSTNLVGSSMSSRLGLGSFNMWTLFPVGSIVFVVGILYVLIVAPRIVPERRGVGGTAERYGVAKYIAEVVVKEGSPLEGKTLADTRAMQGRDADVVRIYRHDRPIRTDLRALPLHAGDVLMMRASAADLVELLEASGLAVRPEGTEAHHLQDAGSVLFEATVSPGHHLRGLTLREARFRQRFGAVVLALRRGPTVLNERISDVRIQYGDTLLLIGDEEAQRTVQRSREFVLAEPLRIEPYRRRKAPLALAIFALVITTASVGWVPLAVAALAGVLAMGLTGCIRAYEIFESVDWEVILVLVGLLPLGIAFISSGASEAMADLLVAQASGLPPVAILGLVYALTFVITQLVTNAAAITIMAPVGAEVALATGDDPLKYVVAATFAASAGFVTPIGYQTNLMVYGPGEYRFSDFFGVGLPLALLVGITTVLLLGYDVVPIW